jgi:hypothetical protein
MGAEEEHVREALPARINFSFFLLMFWTIPEIQADWQICNAHFCAEFKSTRSTQNMSKESWEGACNTCFSELKSDNVTVDNFRPGLVLNVDRQWNFLSIYSRQKSSEKVKIYNFFILKPQRICLPELTFSTHPHKLQNLSFNLAVIFFVCSLRHKIYRQNKCMQDLTVSLNILNIINSM